MMDANMVAAKADLDLERQKRKAEVVESKGRLRQEAYTTM